VNRQIEVRAALHTRVDLEITEVLIRRLHGEVHVARLIDLVHALALTPFHRGARVVTRRVDRLPHCELARDRQRARRVDREDSCVDAPEAPEIEPRLRRCSNRRRTRSERQQGLQHARVTGANHAGQVRPRAGRIGLVEVDVVDVGDGEVLSVQPHQRLRAGGGTVELHPDLVGEIIDQRVGEQHLIARRTAMDLGH
jgi:hypothetical protein